MKGAGWFILIAVVGGLGYWLWRGWQKWAARHKALEARYSEVVATASAQAPAAPPRLAPLPPAARAAPAPDLAALGQQKLLMEAASKAAEAGEPALSIQLYARLVTRYPQSALAAQARAAVDAQKRRLARP